MITDCLVACASASCQPRREVVLSLLADGGIIKASGAPQNEANCCHSGAKVGEYQRPCASDRQQLYYTPRS
eukprot:2996227-Amphidinium_carterae.1